MFDLKTWGAINIIRKQSQVVRVKSFLNAAALHHHLPVLLDRLGIHPDLNAPRHGIPTSQQRSHRQVKLDIKRYYGRWSQKKQIYPIYPFFLLGTFTDTKALNLWRNFANV